MSENARAPNMSRMFGLLMLASDLKKPTDDTDTVTKSNCRELDRVNGITRRRDETSGDASGRLTWLSMARMSFLIGVTAGSIVLSHTAAAQFSENKIKIGVLTDMTGPFADIAGAGSIEAVKMAVEDEGSSIAGIPVEIVSGDFQSKPDVGVAIARRWYDNESVDLIINLVNSSVALAVRQVARERGKIDIVTGGAVSELTSRQCSDTGFHWVLDTYAMAKATVYAVSKTAGRRWFFVTADFAFGKAMQGEASRFLEESGGQIVGSARHPLNSPDFASFLLTAQSSNADVIALANAGTDAINSIKQASEFGLTRNGQKLVALLMFLSDIHAIGLPLAQGLLVTEAFYWDLNDDSRAFARRFLDRMGRAPTSVQAGDYSATRHYLRAIAAEGTDDGPRVAKRMRDTPVNDFFAKGGRIRRDGRHVHDMYLMEVKKPSESRVPWDYYKVVQTIPGDQAFRPISEGDCELARKQ